MAARVLLQRRAAPLAAALMVGSVALYPRTAQAEAPSDRQFSRKPIYDDGFDAFPPAKPTATMATTTTAAAAASLPASTPSPSQTEEPIPAALPASLQPESSTTSSSNTVTRRRRRAPTPTDRLAAQIRRARLFLHAQASTAEDAVDAALSRALALEQSFTATVASLAPARETGERLLPGLVYVLVAGMAGSIVARNRGAALRAAAPLGLGLGAAWVVLPVTMANVGALLWEYERRFPAVADAHLRTREGVERGVYMARAHADLAQRKVYEGVRDAREAVEGWVRKGK